MIKRTLWAGTMMVLHSNCIFTKTIFTNCFVHTHSDGCSRGKLSIMSKDTDMQTAGAGPHL